MIISVRTRTRMASARVREGLDRARAAALRRAGLSLGTAATVVAIGVVAVMAGAVLVTPTSAAAGPASPAAPPAGTITSLAGGPGGPGPATSLSLTPCGLGYSGGSVYVGDSNGDGTGDSIARISTSTGTLSMIAGNGAPLGGGYGAPAAKVPLSFACATAVDSAGNVLTADLSTVQAVAARTGTFYGVKMTAGRVYVVAGHSSHPGTGTATRTALSGAQGLSIDSAGNLIITQNGSPAVCPLCKAHGAIVQVVAVRNGTFYGVKMTAGDIYTVAGKISGPDPSGNAGPARQAWLGDQAGSAVPDHDGNLVLPDHGESDPAAHIAPSVRVVAGRTGAFYGVKMTAGHIYQVAGDGKDGTSGDGGPALHAALQQAGGVAVDGAGNLVLADSGRVRVVAEHTGTYYGIKMTAGDIYGIAGTGHAGYSGDGGSATEAQVSAQSVTVDGAGNVVLGGWDARLEVVAASTGTFYGVKMITGHIYSVAGDGALYSGDNVPPSRDVFTFPAGVASNATGDVTFADGLDNVIYGVPATSGTLYGRTVTAGRSYIVGGNGQPGYSGDGGPAIRAEFSMSTSSAVAVDGSGNVAEADQTSNRARFIAARTGTFFGIKMTAGDVYTVAGNGVPGTSGVGGPAAQAELDDPTAVAFDSPGNLLISSIGLVQVVAAQSGTFYGVKMTAGDLYTIAGNGTGSYSGDGGPATQAGVGPIGLGVDAGGDVLIADNSDRIRFVAGHTGTYYGIKMTARDIYTIAGNGMTGYSGSGGLALETDISLPGAVAADRYGNVAIADFGNSVVWLVSAHTGTYYGIKMTAEHIYQVGFHRTTNHGWALGTDGLGDGGPASQAVIVLPNGVSFTPSGDLLIADETNRIREVSG
jgi:hypothetical protein